MIYVFNKNKIISYIISSFIVIILFAFSSSMIIKDDVELVKISANTISNNQNNLDNTNNINHNKTNKIIEKTVEK